MTAWLKDVIGYGLHAARPAAGSAGALYYETDTSTLFRDNGTTWDALSLTGGGGGAGDLSLIQHVDVPSGGQASIDFTAIPGTYRHLMLALTGRSDAAANLDTILAQLNGDTAANYDWQNMAGAGTSPSFAGARAQTSAQVAQCSAASSPANAPGDMQLWLYNYAGTDWRKNGDALSHYTYDDTSGTGYIAYKHSMQWRSTAAITHVKLYLAAGNWTQHTTAALYGIS